MRDGRTLTEIPSPIDLLTDRIEYEDERARCVELSDSDWAVKFVEKFRRRDYLSCVNSAWRNPHPGTGIRVKDFTGDCILRRAICLRC